MDMKLLNERKSKARHSLNHPLHRTRRCPSLAGVAGRSSFVPCSPGHRCARDLCKTFCSHVRQIGPARPTRPTRPLSTRGTDGKSLLPDALPLGVAKMQDPLRWFRRMKGLSLSRPERISEMPRSKRDPTTGSTSYSGQRRPYGDAFCEVTDFIHCTELDHFVPRYFVGFGERVKLGQGSLKDTFCPFETWLFQHPNKVGYHH